MGLKYLFNYYIPVVDDWILADNSIAPFKVIAQGHNGEDMIVRDQKTFGIVNTLVLSAEKLSDENSMISDEEAKE